MRDKSSPLLDTGDRMPSLELRTVSGRRLGIPDDLGSGFTVIFFYRGYW